MRFFPLVLIPLSVAVAMQPAVDYTKVLEDFYSLKLLDTVSYTSVLESEDYDSCSKGIAWMNLLYFKRAEEEFKRCERSEKDLFIARIHALSGENVDGYLSFLPDSTPGKMERIFVEGVAKRKVDLKEMKRILNAVKGNKDVYLFEYLYFLRKQDLEEAIKEANEYLRGKREVIVDYDVVVLKRKYYPLLLLTARMLYDYAVGQLERAFGMKVGDFLKLEGRELDEKVIDAMFKRPKELKSGRLALKNARILLVYNSNDYTFLSSVKDVPDLGILKSSFVDFLERLKRLLVYISTD